jgi:nitrite reductase/ring-hydroxylating ferredoxin subunit
MGLGDIDNVGTNRRALLAGTGAAGLAVTLAACGSNSPSGSSSGGSGGATSGPLGKTSDIPVQGGKIFDNQGVVVTQPVAGQYKAFSATCTHQGCTVGTVANQAIICPCHGSQFSIADGSVKNGPATQPLPAKTITVANGEITLS